ncbi:MAG TPA: NAD(P)-binding protein [Polyangiaceae bacterium]
MNARRVAVIGAGVSGAAAAWTLARGGARVSVIHDRAGSSALYAGALDDEPDGSSAGLDAEARAFADALGIWRLGAVTLATREGVVRAASGSDRALLDLAGLAGKHVAVADVARDDWDAPLLAGTLAASPWAERTGTRFSAVAVAAIRRGHERRITSHDFAALHDDAERLTALAAVLEASRGEHDAWLLGPWLGTTPQALERLGGSVSVPVGEATSAMGGAAGARFENARDALFAASAIETARARVLGVEPRGDGWLVRFEADERSEDELEAAAVVLASGGVAAGGIRFVWDPVHGAHGFRLGFEAPVELALDGEPGAGSGSLYGPSLDVRGLGVLERVGVHSDGRCAVFRSGETAAGLFVAGDARAARPRTVLEALRSGVEAGRGALLLSHA